MKHCDQCGFLIFEHNAPCPRCAEAAWIAQQALAPQPRPSRLWKVLKWLLVGVLVTALVAGAVITWVLNSFGESLRSLG